LELEGTEKVLPKGISLQLHRFGQIVFALVIWKSFKLNTMLESNARMQASQLQI
jgi:hypothetical protein